MTTATLRLNADTRGLKKATGALKDVERQSAKTEKATNRLSKSYAGMGKVAAASVVAIGALFTRAVIRNTIEQEKAVAQLNSSLKATGRFTPEATKAIQDHAAELQNLTAVGDEVIIMAQAQLATFKSIGGDIFPRATEAALDLSRKFNQGLKESIIQVGKALEDPIKGLGSLSRIGVTFNDVQRDMIRGFVESGDKAQAQAVIMEALEGNVGGAARAYRDTLGGALDAVSNAFGDLLESDSMGGATQALNELADTLSSPAVQQGFANITTALITMVGWFAKATSEIANFSAWLGETLAAAVGGVASDDIDRMGTEILRLTENIEYWQKLQQNQGALNPLQQQQLDTIIAQRNEYQRLIDLQSELSNVPTSASDRVAETLPGSNEEEVKATTKLNEVKREEIGLIKVKRELMTSGTASDILRDLAFETEMIGKTNQERELANALRSLEEEQLIRRLTLGEQGIAMNESENEKIREGMALKYERLAQEQLLQDELLATAQLQQAQAEATEAMYRQIGNNASNAFDAWIDGSKSAKEAFKDFANQVIKDLIRIMIQKAITNAIGGGGGFGDVFSGIFGPGRAVGGRVYPGQVQQIAERGPELLTIGDKAYTVGGPRGGNVSPVTNNKSTVTNVFNLPPAVTRETPNQIAYELNRVQGRASARNR